MLPEREQQAQNTLQSRATASPFLFLFFVPLSTSTSAHIEQITFSHFSALKGSPFSLETMLHKFLTVKFLACACNQMEGIIIKMFVFILCVTVKKKQHTS